MKILFFIFARTDARGGHYHSLNHISQKLGEKYRVQIVTIGYGNAKVLEENPYYDTHIPFNGLNVVDLFFRSKQIIKEFQPDVIHFFDIRSFNILRLFLNSRKRKLILQICGGPNRPKVPFARDIILLSKENYDYYSKLKKLADSNISLIPNRVSQLYQNLFQPIKKIPDTFNFVRICRIGSAYQKSIVDSINLVELLIDKGYKFVNLYIVGFIEDNEIYQQITERIRYSQNIHIVTDENITKEASCILYLADAVIATGRGFMEGASLGKPLLTFNIEDDLPLLVDENNFSEAFYANFSPRVKVNQYNREDNIYKIEKLIAEKSYYQQQAEFAKKMFLDYFDVNQILPQYTKVYQKATHGANKIFKDFIWILRTYIRVWLDSKKNVK